MDELLLHEDIPATEDLNLAPADFWMCRAELWKAEACRLAARNSELTAENGRQAQLIADLQGQLEALTAKVKDLAHRVFGRKTEKEASTAKDQPEQEPPAAGGPPGSSTGDAPCRGQRRGAPGHGRRKHPELPTTEEIRDLPGHEKYCPKCGLPYELLPITEPSEQIDWVVRLERRVTHRLCYRKTCQCPDTPGIITAPAPPKLVKKGMFTVGFIVKLLVLKYLLSMPTNRIRGYLRLEGLTLANGTLAGVMQSVAPFLEPLYDAIRARNAASGFLKVDETGWKVFIETVGKVTRRWWIWVFVSQDTAAFILSPSRSAETPKMHLNAQNPDQESSVKKMLKIMLTDFYSAYRVLEDILHAWCWAHMRRKFIEAARGYQQLKDWSEQWVSRIGALYHLNDVRLASRPGFPEWTEAEKKLRQFVEEEIYAVWTKELADPETHHAARDVLSSMQRQWSGLTLFLDFPEVPLDNNECERLLRTPVVGRKNFYGSGARSSGELAAMLWSILATAGMNNLNPIRFLSALLDACAEAGGRPLSGAELRRFFPWALSEEDARAWGRNTS
jgi:transposase